MMSTDSTRARILDGKSTAEAIRAETAERVEVFRRAAGVAPGLAVVLVGDDPASGVYVRNKEKAARDAGLRSEVVRLPAAAREDDVLDVVARLNADRSTHGILVQLPLPPAVDANRVILAIDPAKDVDGFHPLNAGRLSIGLPGLVPCTPSGIVELLKRHGIPLVGRRAVVLGRSNVVGKPMALLLLREHATVTIAHSRTESLESVASQADVLIVAIGKPGAIGAAHVKPGAAVVDVGIHSVTDETTCRAIFGDDARRLAQVREKGATLAGDVRVVEVADRAAWLSPVPGGVGPLTIAMLLKNTVQAAEASLRAGV